jgi:hypothetical protein
VKVLPSLPILNNSARFANQHLGGKAITQYYPVALTAYFNAVVSGVTYKLPRQD